MKIVRDKRRTPNNSPEPLLGLSRYRELFLSFHESDPASRGEAEVRPARERQSQIRVGGVDWFGDVR